LQRAEFAARSIFSQNTGLAARHVRCELSDARDAARDRRRALGVSGSRERVRVHVLEQRRREIDQREVLAPQPGATPADLGKRTISGTRQVFS
jgi:hypothetical protein